MLYTLGHLPPVRQYQEFLLLVEQVLYHNSFYQKYQYKEQWLTTIFPPFINRWGGIAIVELPLNKYRQEGIVAWLRAELDKAISRKLYKQ